MTITLNRRKLLVGLLAVAMIAAACYIAFLVGQTTRVTEADATSRTRTAVERTVESETEKRLAAVRAVKLAARKRERAHVKRVEKRWYARLKREITAARAAGYSSGQSAGYASGHATGKDEGVEEGIEQGIEEASDELLCSDDKDVDLPPCW